MVDQEVDHDVALGVTFSVIPTKLKPINQFQNFIIVLIQTRKLNKNIIKLRLNSSTNIT